MQKQNLQQESRPKKPWIAFCLKKKPCTNRRMIRQSSRKKITLYFFLCSILLVVFHCHSVSRRFLDKKSKPGSGIISDKTRENCEMLWHRREVKQDKTFSKTNTVSLLWLRKERDKKILFIFIAADLNFMFFLSTVPGCKRASKDRFWVWPMFSIFPMNLNQVISVWSRFTMQTMNRSHISLVWIWAQYKIHTYPHNSKQVILFRFDEDLNDVETTFWSSD